MDDFTLSEVRALIRLVKSDIRQRKANVSMENLYNLENKLAAVRYDKQSHKDNDNE